MVSILKSSLQKEVFQTRGEKLVHVLPLAKVNKEDTKSYLCVYVSSTNDVCLTWLSVAEEEINLKYESRSSWFLKNLTLIDGIDHSQDNAIFSLHFTTGLYTFEACSTATKYSLLRCLRKMSAEYLQQDLQWMHYDSDFVGKSSLMVPDDAVLYMTLCLKAISCACLCSCF
ncbi:exocyst complex component 1-like [Hyperolius riggenbachi]|uniref:exocyst complex component 1-like n=1 Tax=Hyperolius riggenbachi TaxID=752182 RepID=UPI0035A39D64